MLHHITKLIIFASVLMDVNSIDVEGNNDACFDENEHCEFWAGVGECDKNPNYMKISCCESCSNVVVTAPDIKPTVCAEGDTFCEAAKVQAIIPKNANTRGVPKYVKMGDCEDRHPGKCEVWSREGECERNPGWMIINCPHSCNACHLLDPKARCERNVLNISNTPVYGPGDHSKMFSGLKEKYDALYGVTVHSTDPWVVTFDNFVTDEEADVLIKTQKKWERSTDTGIQNEFGEAGRILSTGRTSSNSWCDYECANHPIVSNLLGRIEEVVGIPRGHYESFQVLRYDLGQHYQAHHDSTQEDINKACGPRILTFFLYLSDVEEGGETFFPDLNIAVKPKKGQAVLWPSTYDHDPTIVDPRTRHAAKPVIKGIKFAANAWIHSHDFMIPNLWGCTGSFDEL